VNKNLTKIETEKAPKAIGPYSQAILAGDFLFISGQIPIHPEKGIIIHPTIEGQTRQVLDNIEAILLAAGISFEYVVKTEIYIMDMKDFPVVNAIYAEKFTQANKPARQTLQVAGLPLGSLVEISCVAMKKR
jgi:2-iminobutanoate/2-iminopropanoate deaminase